MLTWLQQSLSLQCERNRQAHFKDRKLWVDVRVVEFSSLAHQRGLLLVGISSIEYKLRSDSIIIIIDDQFTCRFQNSPELAGALLLLKYS